MKAAWFEKFGSAHDVLEIGELDDVQPGDGEVLVRMVSSGVNPSDVKKRAGSFPDLLDNGKVIPHSDGAGIIEATGSGVDDKQVGDRVWVYQAQYGRRFGTAAELLAIDARRAPLLPANTDYAIGACLGIPAMTAHRAVFSDGEVEGQSLLITGGAGRVGHYAIQWAAQAGAHVIATASNSADGDACRIAGASEVVNHRDTNWAQDALQANDGRSFDRIIDVDFGVNLPHTVDVARIGGTIVSYSSNTVKEPRLPFLKMMYKDLTVQLVIVYAMPEEAKQRAILDIEKKLHEAALQHRIAAHYPLESIVAAHERIEDSATRGCVLVDLADESHANDGD